MNGNRIDLTGQVFGKLTAICLEPHTTARNGSVLFLSMNGQLRGHINLG